MTSSIETPKTGDLSKPSSSDTGKATPKETPEQRVPTSYDQAVQRAQEVGQQLEDLQDKHLRLHSEFENFRSRTAREKRALIQSSNKTLLQKFISIADDLERALNAAQAKDGSLQEGVQLIYDKLMQLLDQENVHPMTLEMGAAFDADMHEAIAQKSVEESNQKGKVVEVVEKGYLLGSTEVLRFAKVIIGV